MKKYFAYLLFVAFFGFFACGNADKTTSDSVKTTNEDNAVSNDFTKNSKEELAKRPKINNLNIGTVESVKIGEKVVPVTNESMNKTDSNGNSDANAPTIEKKSNFQAPK